MAWFQMFLPLTVVVVPGRLNRIDTALLVVADCLLCVTISFHYVFSSLFTVISTTHQLLLVKFPSFTLLLFLFLYYCLIFIPSFIILNKISLFYYFNSNQITVVLFAIYIYMYIFYLFKFRRMLPNEAIVITFTIKFFCSLLFYFSLFFNVHLFKKMLLL